MDQEIGEQEPSSAHPQRQAQPGAPAPWLILYSKAVAVIGLIICIVALLGAAISAILGEWLGAAACFIAALIGLAATAFGLVYPRMRRDFELEASAREGKLRFRGELDDATGDR